MELRYGVMVAQEILVLFVEVRILLSQRNPRNSRGDNELQKSVTKNGTETGQLSHPTGSLYSILLELCERKKCLSSNPSRIKNTYLRNSTKAISGISFFMSKIRQQENLNVSKSNLTESSLSGKGAELR